MRAEEDRRLTDHRLDQLEKDFRGLQATWGEERTMLFEDLGKQRSAIQAHTETCTERWKNNDARHEDHVKRMDGQSAKLNAIIGGTFLTLLTVCGFFVALWIDRQDQRQETRRQFEELRPLAHR